jgi:hypothetical protein
MPTARKRPIVLLALSPAATAVALGLREQTIYDAIEAGELGPVYINGVKRRLLVSDIEAYVRGWSQLSKPMRKSHAGK